MAFTSSIFLFVFFPLCLGGYYLAAGVERGVAALRRLRQSLHAHCHALPRRTALYHRQPL